MISVSVNSYFEIFNLRFRDQSGLEIFNLRFRDQSGLDFQSL